MIMHDIYIVFKTPMDLQILFSVNSLWTLSLSTFVFSIENKSVYADGKAMGVMYTSLIAYTFT